jgi:predicted transposase YdaD
MFDYERSKAMPYVTSIERMAKKEGLEEGWQKGQQEGWQKGRQEGEQEGQITSLQAAIVEVLQTRFGIIPDSLRECIRQIRDAGALTKSLQQAVLCSDMAAFQHGIRPEV